MLCLVKEITKRCLKGSALRATSAPLQNRVRPHRRSLSYLQQVHGQPTSLTHPHLINDGEVVPGITLTEFQERREHLVDRIASDSSSRGAEPVHMVIVPSATKSYMSEKIPYVFRQNTDFLYLSGCQEPDSALVLSHVGGKSSSVLFVQKKDPHSELWDGPKTGTDAAPGIFGVDQALPIHDFESYVRSFLREHTNAAIWYDHSEIIQPALHKQLYNVLSKSNNQVYDSLKTKIHQLRLIKSPAEIKLMQRSCEVASSAIAETISKSRPGISEHEIFAEVDYRCRTKGAEFLAYPPVVASGNNANIIHYIANNQIVRSGDLVLMDAGCEYHGYSSDITRTWPINGTFTEQQRILYEIVLDVQKSLIQRLRDMPTLDSLFHEMCFLMGKRLQEVGLVPKTLAEDKLLAAAYSYCPHHVSHYLGMDVHDTGKISRSVNVQPGMIITIEPGIYVNARNKLARPEFYGLGIRIEDDVLITSDGPVVLTKNCPKEVADIEALAKENQNA